MEGERIEPTALLGNEQAAATQWLGRARDRVLGFNPRDYRDPRVRGPVFSTPSEGQIRYAEMIAKQIEVEQGLAGTRMTWNLTFQGFTIAAYALVASSDSTVPAKAILETAIGVSSAMIAYVTMRGIIASQIQRQYLKDCWAANRLTRFFPEPFSISTTSTHGRLPAYVICLVLIGMWAILLLTQLLGEKDEPMKVQLVPPVTLPVLATPESSLASRHVDAVSGDRPASARSEKPTGGAAASRDPTGTAVKRDR